MPFPGGLNATANGLLLLSLGAAVLYAFMVRRPPSWRRTVAKTLSVALLGVLSHSVGGPLLLALALMASASGDAALAAEEERWFLPGLVAFMIAHVLYIALFATSSQGLAVLAEPLRATWALAIAAAAGMLLAKVLPIAGWPMRLPIIACAAAIAAMGIAALTVPGYALAAGACLFIASDAILAARLMAEHSWNAAWSGYVVWATYYSAQLVIALAILL